MLAKAFAMKRLILAALLLIAAVSSAQAATVSVLLSDDTLTVLGPQPAGTGGAVTIDTTDARWTTYLATLTAAATKNTARGARTAALTGGITLTCTATGTLNLSGTYAVDQDFLNYLMDMGAGNFPNAFVTGKPVIDTSNVLHTFSNPAAFNTFYQIVGGYWIALKVYYMQIQSGLSPSLPTNTSSAC